MENEVEIIAESPIEEQSPDGDGHAETPEGSPIVPIEAKILKRRRRKKAEMPVEVKDNHCPACVAGQSMDTGRHILNTEEHPLAPPPPAPEKVKHQPRAMHKELRGASSFAEKMLPKKIAEKAKAVAEVARLEAEIQELVRVLQALGGQMPVGMRDYPMVPVAPQPYTMGAIMSDAPLYPQQANIATMPPVSRAGGGALDASLAPAEELNDDAFLTERSQLTGGSGWV